MLVTSLFPSPPISLGTLVGYRSELWLVFPKLAGFPFPVTCFLYLVTSTL